jgi:hypothetical protein
VMPSEVWQTQMEASEYHRAVTDRTANAITLVTISATTMCEKATYCDRPMKMQICCEVERRDAAMPSV